jgi:hypothetical protein
MESNATQNAHSCTPQMRKRKGAQTKNPISTNKILNDIPNTTQQAKANKSPANKRKERVKKRRGESQTTFPSLD